MRRISITYNIPVLKPDGVLLNIRDSFEIFYLKDFIMYKLPYMHTQENSKEILSSNVKYKYFGYKKSNFYGFLYDSVNAKVGTKQQIDLFLSKNGFANFKFYDNANDSLFKKYIFFADISVEEYLPKVKYDQSYGDTTYLYYTDKLKGIDYSFSKELDSIKKQKIFKVKILYNEQFYKGYNFKFPKRQYLFEMKEMPMDNLNSMGSLFEKIKTASQR